MIEEANDNTGGGSQRSFNVVVFIVHPTMAPADITSQLDMLPQYSRCVGDPQMTPTGRMIGGTWPDTRWRFSVRYETWDQYWVDEIDELVGRLVPHKSFFERLRQTGGEAQLIVQFLGDGYFGDTVSHNTLATLANLKLDFGIECFNVPQNE